MLTEFGLLEYLHCWSKETCSFAGVQQPIRKKLPNKHKFTTYIALKALSKDGEVEKKDKEKVVGLLHISLRTVGSIWRFARDQIVDGSKVDV